MWQTLKLLYSRPFQGCRQLDNAAMTHQKRIAVLLQIALIWAVSSQRVNALDAPSLNESEVTTTTPVLSLSAAMPETVTQTSSPVSFTSAQTSQFASSTDSSQTVEPKAAENLEQSHSVAPPVMPTAEAVEILHLTNECLFKEIDLERFYLQYHLLGSHEPKYRRLRFFLLQQTAGSAFLASNLINTIETAKHFKTPEEVSGRVFLGTNKLGLTGTVLGATSSGLELCSNGYTALKNKWTKNDPATARMNALARLHEIDELLMRRTSFVDRCRSADARSLYIAEGKVLKTFRNWCVYEFADAYSDVKSLQASYNVFYALDVSAYVISFAGYILGIQADKEYNKVFPALHVGFVGDTIFTSEAPLSTLAYSKLYSYWWNNLAKSLGEQPHDAEADAKKQMIHLEYLAANADDATLAAIGPIASRLTIYSFWSTRYDKYIDHRMGEMRRQSRIALQSKVTGPLLGATGIAQDCMNAVGIYRYRNNEYKQNSLAFAGAATSTLGGIASVGLTGWWFTDQILDDKRNRRDKLLPQFLLSDRLRTLSLMEDMLRGNKQQ